MSVLRLNNSSLLTSNLPAVHCEAGRCQVPASLHQSEAAQLAGGGRVRSGGEILFANNPQIGRQLISDQLANFCAAKLSLGGTGDWAEQSIN